METLWFDSCQLRGARVHDAKVFFFSYTEINFILQIENIPAVANAFHLLHEQA